MYMYTKEWMAGCGATVRKRIGVTVAHQFSIVSGSGCCTEASNDDVTEKNCAVRNLPRYFPIVLVPGHILK